METNCWNISLNRLLVHSANLAFNKKKTPIHTFYENCVDCCSIDVEIGEPYQIYCCFPPKKEIIFLPKQMDWNLWQKCVNFHFLWLDNYPAAAPSVVDCRHNFLLIKCVLIFPDKFPGALIYLSYFSQSLSYRILSGWINLLKLKL